jgi:hypothetical protein
MILKLLKKKYPKNWIGNDSFYKMNKFFFMGSLFFMVLQAMSFPCLSEIPSLAMILLMCSLYAIRKQQFVAGTYRKFVFFLLYLS